MATILDAGILGNFSLLFATLLVLFLVYALLQWTKLLGENKVVHALIALILAIMVFIFPLATKIVEMLSQWFTVLLIVGLFAVLIYKLFGASDSDITNVLKNHAPLRWFLFGIIIVLVAGVVGKAVNETYGSKSVYLEENNDTIPQFSVEYKGHYINPLLHPNLLGLMLIGLIAIFTIALLAGKPYKGWP